MSRFSRRAELEASMPSDDELLSYFPFVPSGQYIVNIQEHGNPDVCYDQDAELECHLNDIYGYIMFEAGQTNRSVDQVIQYMLKKPMEHEQPNPPPKLRIIEEIPDWVCDIPSAPSSVIYDMLSSGSSSPMQLEKKMRKKRFGNHYQMSN